jgi:hypothetical protein
MFEEILYKIGLILPRLGIPYMIIGGQAVLVYGEPRLTRDIDITLGVNTEHLDTVLAALRELSLNPIPKDIESFVQQTMVLPALDEKTGIRVDFIFSSTPYEAGAIKRAKKIMIKEHEVFFASPEDVVIHKIFAGRPRDLEDVRTIIVKNPEIDRQYILKWLKEFDKTTEQKDFLKTFELLSKEF